MKKYQVISDKLLQAKIGFKPHKFQQKLLDSYNSGKTEIVISAGMQSGKSIFCAYIILKEILSDNKTIAIISPNYDLGQRIFDYLKEWLLTFSPENPPRFQTKPFPRVDLPWGSFCEIKSAEAPEGMLGKAYNLIVVDEASRVPRNVFQQYILPRISSTKGKVVIISTPLKIGDWFYEEYLSCKDSDTTESFTFTSLDNPYFDRSNLEILKKKIPKVIYEREFMASFTEGSASVFSNIRECISEDLPREAINGHYHLIGLDLAKADDFTAICVLDRDTNEIIYMDRWNKLEYPIQKQKISAIARNLKGRIIIDARNVGSYMGSELRKDGLWVEDFYATGTISPDLAKRGSKERLVEKAVSFFESKDISLPKNPLLLDELESYSYTISPFGNVRYGVPSGLHDDMVDALMLSLWQARPLKTSEERIHRIKAQRREVARSQTSRHRQQEQYE